VGVVGRVDVTLAAFLIVPQQLLAQVGHVTVSMLIPVPAVLSVPVGIEAVAYALVIALVSTSWQLLEVHQKQLLRCEALLFLAWLLQQVVWQAWPTPELLVIALA
jgi:hypothetical protein